MVRPHRRVCSVVTAQPPGEEQRIECSPGDQGLDPSSAPTHRDVDTVSGLPRLARPRVRSRFQDLCATMRSHPSGSADLLGEWCFSEQRAQANLADALVAWEEMFASGLPLAPAVRSGPVLLRSDGSHRRTAASPMDDLRRHFAKLRSMLCEWTMRLLCGLTFELTGLRRQAA